MQKRIKRLALAWCALAVLVCAAIVLVGERILVLASPGQDFLRQKHALLYTNGGYYDDRMPLFVFRKSANGTLACDVHGYLLGGEIHCVFPAGANLNSLVPNYTESEGPLYDGEKRLYSGISSLNLKDGPLVLTGKGQAYTLIAHTSALPVLSVRTYQQAPVYDTGSYVAGEAALYSEEGSLIRSIPASLRVRGNSTANLPKVPYKIKSSVQESLLGLPPDSEWTLLANFLDPTLARNETAYRMAGALGMRYVPNQVMVELYMNGMYQGVYALGVQVGLGGGGVNMPPLHRQNGRWEGGYLLEMDARALEGAHHTQLGAPLVIKEPPAPDAQQTEKILADIQALEAALRHNGGENHEELIDARTFADIYLINEVARNTDAALPSSIFIYRGEDGRLCMGPVWDMDLAFGGFSEETEGLVLNGGIWFERLLQSADFRRLVMREYAKLDRFFDALEEDTRVWRQKLAKAFANNYTVTYAGLRDYPDFARRDMFSYETDRLIGWISRRRAWLDENLGKSLRQSGISLY